MIEETNQTVRRRKIEVQTRKKAKGDKRGWVNKNKNKNEEGGKI